MQYILTDDSVTCVIGNKTHTISKSNAHFSSVVAAIKAGDNYALEKAIDLASSINEFGEGKIVVRDGVVFYGDTPMNNSLTDRILRMMRDGFNVTPMVKFMDRLMNNPSGRAVQELYRFLESNNLPLTDDGHFLAYKNVREDYTDKHSGKFDNSVGSICEMPRNQVMDDPNVTCSTGLHFCSIEYLNGMWGHDGHTMIVKIDPADVVSIPVDYNNSKGRCCKYTVIGEHMDRERDTLSDRSVYSGAKSAYDQGYFDSMRGREYDNPYEEYDDDHWEYDTGYTDGAVDSRW